MKGIRPILFLLVTVLLICAPASVPIASATVSIADGDLPAAVPSSGNEEDTVDGADPGDDEGDPDFLGDGLGAREYDGIGDNFDAITIQKSLWYLLLQMRLLVL